MTTYVVCVILSDTMAKETIDQFIARGGKIKTIQSRYEFQSHTSRFSFKDLQNPVATAPGGRIAPGLRNKTWVNRVKKAHKPRYSAA